MLLCIYINNQACTIYSYQFNAILGAFGGGGGETGGGGGGETGGGGGGEMGGGGGGETGGGGGDETGGGGGEAEKGGGGGAEDTLWTVQFVVALKETVATTRECIGCFVQYCIYFGMVVNPRMGEKQQAKACANYK